MSLYRRPAAVLGGAAFVLICTAAHARVIEHVSSLAGLQRAIDKAPADGASIQLARGTYHQSSTLNIRNKNNITISGTGSNFNATILQGPGINNRRLGINVKVRHSNHVTLRNMTLKDSYYHGVQIKKNSDYFTADHLQTVDNGEAGFKVASPHANSGVGYSDNGTIENSVIGFTRNGQRHVVEGIDMVGVKNWRVRGNTIKNIKKANGRAAYAVFAKGNAQNIVFANNVVKNSFIGLSFGGGGTGKRFFRNGQSKFETRGGVIKDNKIYNSDDVGIYLNKAKNFRVVGNTVLGTGIGTGAIAVRFPESSGMIRGNKISGSIKLRNGAHAVLRDNPDPPVPDWLSDRSSISVDAPAGPAFWTLLMVGLGTIGGLYRRRANNPEKARV
jgi:parallel beta-helix repeat protein